MEGGLFRGAVYMVIGLPGAGKTILGNQICFEHVRSGGKALYLTLLTESHARLISSLREMEFFEPSFLANGLSYLSGYQALEKPFSRASPGPSWIRMPPSCEAQAELSDENHPHRR